MLEKAEKIHQYDIHPMTKKLLHSRGLDDEGINEFLSWDLKKLPLLTDMKDMDKAAERIVRAVKNREKIGIYGDYDVDGTTACALFYHFFQMINTEVELMQPSRFIEGYGIHPVNIENACAQGIHLLITVDCGITNSEACHSALEKNLDLIITDHHTDILNEMPQAYAIVNPNRRDEPKDSPLRILSGVAVAFAICIKTKKLLALEDIDMPTLYPLLQFVAIGTICDLVKLTPLNLKLVRHGLRQIPQTQFVGIRSFLRPEDRKRGRVSSEKLSFEIGPILNSKGRLDHPEKSLKLLIANNNKDAHKYYSHLEMCNRERKQIQAKVFKEAREQIQSQILEDHHTVSIAYQGHWHEGVIGIVASKLVETFNVPAVVMANTSEQGIIKGSARSVGRYDLFQALKQCEDLFIKFGGHRAAAGFSMNIENLSLFKERMKEILEQTPLIERTRQDTYDLEIQSSDINRRFIKSLELLEPCGMGNPKPIFKIRNLKIDSYDILKDVHVRWTFKRHSHNSIIYHKGISFNYLTKLGRPHPDFFFKEQEDSNVRIYASLGINIFAGREFVQFYVDRVELD